MERNRFFTNEILAGNKKRKNKEIRNGISQMCNLKNNIIEWFNRKLSKS